MATSSSILAQRIPRTGELGRLHSPWSHKDSDTTEQLIHVFFTICFVEAIVHSLLQHFLKNVWCLFLCCKLHQVLVATHGIFNCGVQTLTCSVWDLVHWPEMEPRPLHWEQPLDDQGSPLKNSSSATFWMFAAAPGSPSDDTVLHSRARVLPEGHRGQASRQMLPQRQTAGPDWLCKLPSSDVLFLPFLW